MVDMQPSTSIRLKLSRQASDRARRAWSGSTMASVVIRQIMVASCGAIIPEPLTMPPSRQPEPSRATVLVQVSVVNMALAAASPASWLVDSSWAAWSMPASMGSRCSRWPMIPVEQTATCSAGRPRFLPVRSAMALAWSRPSEPVQALALPELMTTAPARPSSRILLVQMTGAARKRLGVKTPTAVSMGPLLTTKARLRRREPPGRWAMAVPVWKPAA